MLRFGQLLWRGGRLEIASIFVYYVSMSLRDTSIALMKIFALAGVVVQLLGILFAFPGFTDIATGYFSLLEWFFEGPLYLIATSYELSLPTFQTSLFIHLFLIFVSLFAFWLLQKNPFRWSLLVGSVVALLAFVPYALIGLLGLAWISLVSGAWM